MTLTCMQEINVTNTGRIIVNRGSSMYKRAVVVGMTAYADEIPQERQEKPPHHHDLHHRTLEGEEGVIGAAYEVLASIMASLVLSADDLWEGRGALAFRSFHMRVRFGALKISGPPDIRTLRRAMLSLTSSMAANDSLHFRRITSNSSSDGEPFRKSSVFRRCFPSSWKCSLTRRNAAGLSRATWMRSLTS